MSRPGCEEPPAPTPALGQPGTEVSAANLNALDGLLPPPGLMKGQGEEQFKAIGARWVQTFQQYGGLQPTERVLDVGCGPGRMALALAGFLRSPGRYEGFDIRRKDIRWCQTHIEPLWAGSHFQWLDVHNRHYNPTGQIKPWQVPFPYPDQSFDFVFLTSVFTHMLLPELRHYLHEIRRVLSPGGRCLITYFLVNSAAKKAMQAGTSRLSFRRRMWARHYARDFANPEDAVAYEERFIRRLYTRAGLSIVEPIRYGGWRSIQAPGPEVRHTQDIIVAQKA